MKSVKCFFAGEEVSVFLQVHEQMEEKMGLLREEVRSLFKQGLQLL